METLEVVAEYLYGNLRFRTAQHRVDTMAYWLAYLHIHSRNGTEFFAQLASHLAASTPTFVKAVWRLYFAHVHAEGVFVEFGTACLAGNGAYFRHTHYDALGLTPDTVAFLQRDTGECGNVYCERAFVEHGQETSAEGKEQRESSNEKHSHGADDHLRPAQRGGKRA